MQTGEGRDVVQTSGTALSAKLELVRKLRALGGPGDPEYKHGEADRLLLEYIGDPDVSAAFDAVEKWYG